MTKNKIWKMLMHLVCHDILINRSVLIGTGWQDKLFLQLFKSSAQHIPVDKSANYIYTNYYSPKNFELRRVK